MRFLPAVFLIAILLTGCRTYGGYGSEEALFAQIERSQELLSGELSRLEGDRAALASAAASQVALSGKIADMDALLEDYRDLGSRYEELAAPLSGSSSYRNLHRALGAMVSEHQVVRDRYRRLLSGIAQATGNANERGLGASAQYQVEPVYFARLRASLERLNMRDAVAASV